LKEFPINIIKVFGNNVVFSGGGFFRFFPYTLIRHWAKKSPYMMTYFHPRDFDPGQPMVQTLPFMRKFKSYVGLSTSFSKFQRLLDDFEFVDIRKADELIDWERTRMIKL